MNLDADAIHLTGDIWRAVCGRPAEWVANGPTGARKFGMSSGDEIEVVFGWNAEATLPLGAMQIDVDIEMMDECANEEH